MKAGEASNLYRSPSTGNKVLDYASAHSTPLDDKLVAFHARAAEGRQDSRMLSSNAQSQVHGFLARMIGAKRGCSSLPTLHPNHPYDIVFLDANKEGYITYLTTLLDKSPPSSTTGRFLRPGALIIADNVLRSGLVADDSLPLEGEGRSEENWRSHIKAIREFNDACLRNERLETVMLPLWDGVSLLRLKD
ncbi:hypothetical protein CDD80_567 [Ophiocordyceps camponoti-rufipedis]|uniref:O-methyltransferase domain-containing protein n=1 Tax=Ophiocordyceps camponoti-rufipedis TaxID=2004952 RepID=A0A2C5YL51_9HYPO|nr:hypothetical protein CDD80_567 [Ophiocordyceps camponoti-rufipedis]